MEGAGVSVAEEEPELVLRWSVVVVVAVDVKLMLWRSSVKSSSHGGGSIVERWKEHAKKVNLVLSVNIKGYNIYVLFDSHTNSKFQLR